MALHTATTSSLLMVPDLVGRKKTSFILTPSPLQLPSVAVHTGGHVHQRYKCMVYVLPQLLQKKHVTEACLSVRELTSHDSLIPTSLRIRL